MAYRELAIAASYTAIEVRAGELSSFLEQSNLTSLSLTMPLKEEAIALADLITPIAREISSGNTLHRVADQWSLTSTDVDGFSYALNQHLVSQVDRCLIIGAGATARAALPAVNKIAREVFVVNRNPDRIRLMDLAARDLKVSYLPWELTDEINRSDLVINTVPGKGSEFFISSIENPKGILFEVLYNPWPTQLAKAWRSSGAQVIDGLDLLIHQAISQVEIFSRQSVDRSAMYALMRPAALSVVG
jgi:shikimate dehydrogenase